MQPFKRARAAHDPVLAPKDLGRTTSRILFDPSLLALTEWGASSCQGLVRVVPGPHRHALLEGFAEGEWRRFHPKMHLDLFKPASTDWIHDSLVENMTQRVLRLPVKDYKAYRPGVWELLWALVTVNDFVLEEPLRSRVDQSSYLVHDVHRALWEARFLALEHGSPAVVDRFLTLFLRWMTGCPIDPDSQEALRKMGVKRLITSPPERFDALLCLLTMGMHNGLIGRTLFLFDDLEQALENKACLRQLWEFIEACRRWSPMGYPVGILIGFLGSHHELLQLRQRNAKLAREVDIGLQWAKKIS